MGPLSTPTFWDQTCKPLAAATRAKVLWLHIMARDVRVSARGVPPYCKPVEELESAQVEVLVVHALRVRRHTTTGQGGPVTTVALNRPHSVTWTHVLLGTWLLVASSDSSTSTLAVWRLSSILGAQSLSKEPTEFYLDGPVRDGRVQVRNGRAVVVLEIHSP